MSKFEEVKTEKERAKLHALRRRFGTKEIPADCTAGSHEQKGIELLCVDDSVYFLMETHDKVVAACSLTLADSRALPSDWFSQLQLAKVAHVSPEKVAIVSLLADKNAIESVHALEGLLAYILDVGVRRGVLLFFARPDPSFVFLYQRCGYRCYSTGCATEGSETYCIPMVLIAPDLEYMKKVNGKSLQVLERFHARDAAIFEHFNMQRLYQIFPMIQKIINVFSMTSEELEERLVDHARSLNLRTQSLLAGLSGDELHALSSEAAVIAVKRGDKFVSEHDASREIFVVVEGLFEARKSVSDVAYPMNLIAPGESFGEISYFLEGVRTADVYALLDSTVLVINSRTLEALTRHSPEVAVKLLSNVARLLCQRIVRKDAVHIASFEHYTSSLEEL